MSTFGLLLVAALVLTITAIRKRKRLLSEADDLRRLDCYRALTEGDPVTFRGQPATVKWVSGSDGQVWVTLDSDPPRRFGKDHHPLHPEDLGDVEVRS